MIVYLLIVPFWEVVLLLSAAYFIFWRNYYESSKGENASEHGEI